LEKHFEALQQLPAKDRKWMKPYWAMWDKTLKQEEKALRHPKGIVEEIKDGAA
jgi:hypothetical protein